MHLLKIMRMIFKNWYFVQSGHHFGGQIMQLSQRVQKDKLTRMVDSLPLFVYRSQLSSNPRQDSSVHNVESLALHLWDAHMLGTGSKSFLSFLALRVMPPSQDSTAGRWAPSSEVETAPRLSSCWKRVHDCAFRGGTSISHFCSFPKVYSLWEPYLEDWGHCQKLVIEKGAGFCDLESWVHIITGFHFPETT